MVTNDVTELESLPGTYVGLIDRGLGILPGNRAPKVLILGTASKGQTDRPYYVQNTSTAASRFGSTGTLVRGMYEVKQAGAQNVELYRIGSTAAKLEHVGDSTGVAGYTIETIRKDDDAGTVYTVYYDDTSDRLVVWNSETGIAVWDSTGGTETLNYGEVIVSGSRAAGGGPDIGGASAGVAFASVTATGVSYTAGTDGTSPSRMELYEYLYRAYKDLEGQDFDFVVPMDVNLDDKNIADGDSFSASYISGIVSGGTYPTAGSDDDIIGKFFVEEYRGENYFFWDLNGDGVAELYPSGIGVASGTVKCNGESLTSSDFHEVNFGFQLAYWCHLISTNHVETLGVIGMRPPSSLSRADITAWIGHMPTFHTTSNGTQYINSVADNGSGLLGNKFMAGQWGFRSGSPAYGGMVLTDTEFMDGTEQLDSNDKIIDIGRYISVVAAYLRFFNQLDTTGWGYAANGGPSYIGFVSTLDEKDAPTNQVMKSAQPLFTVSPRLVDRLTTVGYVYVYSKPKGLVVSDSPTGARPDSDFRRLTTMRIIKRVIDVFRAKADPFIGKAAGPPTMAALYTAITQGLDRLVSGGYITRYELDISQSPFQKVVGDATAELVIVPAWELRRIHVNLSLRPE